MLAMKRRWISRDVTLFMKVLLEEEYTNGGGQHRSCKLCCEHSGSSTINGRISQPTTPRRVSKSVASGRMPLTSMRSCPPVPCLQHRSLACWLHWIIQTILLLLRFCTCPRLCSLPFHHLFTRLLRYLPTPPLRSPNSPPYVTHRHATYSVTLQDINMRFSKCTTTSWPPNFDLIN